MTSPWKLAAASTATALAIALGTTGALAQTHHAPSPKAGGATQVPPSVDTDNDGVPDAWDRDANGVADAWDSDGDGKPDLYDDDGDGKPDTQAKADAQR